MYYDTLQSSHSLEEMHELLVMGQEFLDLRMVKIGPGYLFLVMDSLLARLEE